MADEELWVCAVVAETVGKQPVVAVLKEASEAECKALAKAYEENPDKVEIVGHDGVKRRGSEVSWQTTIKFVTCPVSLIGEDWRDSLATKKFDA